MKKSKSKVKQFKKGYFGSPGFLAFTLFVFAFSIFGVYKITQSNAACYGATFSYDPYRTKACVADIQGLVNWDLCEYQSSSCKYLNVDGRYGNLTKGYVGILQNRWGIKVDGVVGPQTWQRICNPHLLPAPGWWYMYAKHAGCPGR